jgi:hypothetical protein
MPPHPYKIKKGDKEIINNKENEKKKLPFPSLCSSPIKILKQKITSCKKKRKEKIHTTLPLQK